MSTTEMKIEYDNKADAWYICLQDKLVDHTKELSDLVLIDYAIDSSIVGIEVLFCGKPELTIM